MGFGELLEPSLRMIMFGGKGGVGKTTCAAAAGLYLAGNNQKTLLISTDPAHSLSDSLGREIGSDIRRIEGVNNLCAIEVSAEKAFSEFRAQYDEELRSLFNTSSYLDDEDIDAILGLPIPGIDEVMGFKKIVDLIEKGGFDKYVVDTAPTGHALRLLMLPGLLDAWIKVVAKMRWKYRYMVERFSGRYREDSTDDFLMSLKMTVKNIEALLRDKRRCEFVVVTIPEYMAVRETERLIAGLLRYGMSVKRLIINFVERNCPHCGMKRDWQDKYINKLKDKYGDLEKMYIPLQSREIKGVDTLNSLLQGTGSLING